MENKVLIRLIVPEVDGIFDVFVPVNEVVWKIKKILIKCVDDVTSSNFGSNENSLFINAENGRIYNNNEIIINTDIRNASELLLVTVGGNIL